MGHRLIQSRHQTPTPQSGPQRFSKISVILGDSGAESLLAQAGGIAPPPRPGRWPIASHGEPSSTHRVARISEILGKSRGISENLGDSASQAAMQAKPHANYRTRAGKVGILPPEPKKSALCRPAGKSAQPEPAARRPARRQARGSAAPQAGKPHKRKRRASLQPLEFRFCNTPPARSQRAEPGRTRHAFNIARGFSIASHRRQRLLFTAHAKARSRGR